MLGVVGAASAVTISFEEAGLAPEFFIDTTPLRNEYAAQGVVFSGPSALTGGAILNRFANFGIQPLSGDNFLAFNNDAGATYANGAKPIGSETLTFSTTMQSVSIYAGSRYFATAKLEVFDASWQSLGSFSTTQSVGNWVHLSMAVGGIRYAQISSNVADYVFDDLEFVAAPVPEPATVLLAMGALGAAARRRRATRA